MIAQKLISDSVTPLKTSDTAVEALKLMEEFKVSHLPIVNNEQFLGIISEGDILEHNNFNDAIGSHRLSLTGAFVTNDKHIFEIIKTAGSFNLSLIPVVGDDNIYLGVILLQNLIKGFSEIISAWNPGGIIVLELNLNDYSLTEIANIVESNDAKILSMYVATHTDSTKIEITLKLNRMDITSVLQTFNRYQYVVKASFFESDFFDNLKDRYDSFIHYLNI